MNVLIIGLGKLGLLRFHLLKKNKNVNNIFLFDYNINNIKIQKNKKVQIKLQLKSNLNKLEFFQIFLFLNILLHNLHPYATLKFYLFKYCFYRYTR
jgi:hypothetical protein